MRFYKQALALAFATLTLGASAQFDGPAPLAWRWTQTARMSPSGAPLVEGDTVYVSLGQRFFALNKDTGNQKWRFPLGAPSDGNFLSMPVLAGNTAAALSDRQSVYAVDAATGKPKWERVLTKGAISPPVAAENYVVVARTDNTLEAFDAQTGADVWSDPLRLDAGITGGLASYEDTVIFFNSSSELVCISVPTQKQLWKTRFTSLSPKTKPVIYGDAVYVNSGNFLAAVNVASGRGLWEVDAGDQLIFDPAPSPNVIMVVTQNGKLMTFDRSGHKISKVPFDIGTTPVASPAAVGDMFIIPSGNGSLKLVDPRSGLTLWNFVVPPMDRTVARQPGQPVRAYVTAAGPATIAGKTLLVMCRDGSLLAFDRRNGVDLTPPKVKMVDPNPGDQLSGQPPLIFAFTISDDASGVDQSTLKINLDGKPVEFEETKDHYFVVRVSSLGAIKSLSDGRHVIAVTVSDWMGNQANESFSVQIDNSLRPRLPANAVPARGQGGGGGNEGGGRSGGRRGGD